MSDEQLSVSLGKRVSVFCNVSGHPQPQLYWFNKHNGRTLVRDKHVYDSRQGSDTLNAPACQ